MAADQRRWPCPSRSRRENGLSLEFAASFDWQSARMRLQRSRLSDSLSLSRWSSAISCSSVLAIWSNIRHCPAKHGIRVSVPFDSPPQWMGHRDSWQPDFPGSGRFRRFSASEACSAQRSASSRTTPAARSQFGIEQGGRFRRVMPTRLLMPLRLRQP